MKRARQYHPLHWFDAPHPHRPISVWLMDDEMYPDFAGEQPLGGEKYAYFCSETWRFIVWAGMRKNDHMQTILHELGHAYWDHDIVLSSINEEKALQAIQATLAEMLKRQGWELPPLPDGWESLAAHARWLRYGRAQRSPDDASECD